MESIYMLPIGESDVICEEDHALGQLLRPVIPECSTLQPHPCFGVNVCGRMSSKGCKSALDNVQYMYMMHNGKDS